MFPFFTTQLPLPWLVVVAVCFGAAIGSFITLLTYRLPRNEKIGLKRSHCPQCHTPLGPRDLVPLLTWLAARGKCRHCNVRVSVRYPLTEFACAAGAGIIAWRYGQTLEALALVGLWWGIVALILTDLEHYIILDEVQIYLALCGLLYHHALGGDVLDVLQTGAIAAAFGLVLKYGFLFLRNKDGLGLGDVKFLFVAGVWLRNPLFLVPFLFYSGLFGIVLGLVWQRISGSARFPFGPALAVALLLCILVPEATQYFWKFFGLLH